MSMAPSPQAVVVARKTDGVGDLVDQLVVKGKGAGAGPEHE